MAPFGVAVFEAVIFEKINNILECPVKQTFGHDFEIKK